MTATPVLGPIWPGIPMLRQPVVKWAVVFLSLSALYFVTVFRGLSVLAMLMVAGGYIVSLSSTQWAKVARAAPLLIYAVFAVVSTLWSDAPALTLRLGVQLLLTIAIALALYQTIGFKTILTAVFAAGLLACVASMLVMPGALTGAYPLTGIAASKNQMAFFASTLALSSTALVADRAFPSLLRLVAAGGLLVSVVCLAAAQSAGALVSSAVGCAMVLAARAFILSPVPLRAVVLIGGILLTPIVLVAQPLLEREVNQFAQDVLDKDTSTLTGRTYLWERARSYIAEEPLVGHGYGAFWRQGNLEAEGIWRAYSIKTREGFNFHNQFYEAWVDLGLVGLCILGVMLAVSAAAMVLRLLRGGNAELPFYIGIYVSMVLRVAVESSLLVQFSAITILFVMATAAAIYGPDYAPALARARQRRPLRRLKEDRGLVQERSEPVRRKTGRRRQLVQLRQTPKAAKARFVRAKKKPLRQTRAPVTPVRGPPQDDA